MPSLRTPYIAFRRATERPVRSGGSYELAGCDLMPKKRKSDSRSTGNRKTVDRRTAIISYVQHNPDAQYFAVLEALHRRGIRINRQGNHQLYGWWAEARRLAGR